MEIPGTAALAEAKLHISPEREHHLYFLEDSVSGKMLRISSRLTRSFANARSRSPEKRRHLDESEAAEAAVLSGYLRSMRESTLAAKPGFNPLFMQLPLFEVGPAQRHLAGVARLVFSPAGAAFLVCMAMASLWVATATDWAMASRLGDVFSLDAILLFALFAPLLRLLHEMGHILAATRYGVNVRKCGLSLIALYPMPFVDCSEAEYRASRKERIVISLAGLFADLTIGFTAFLMWHFVSDAAMRQIFSNIFLFNTLTTLFFNLNPLVKADGYFALSDAVGKRNFNIEAMLAMRRLRSALGAVDVKTAAEIARAESFKLLYAAASMAYRIYILLTIGWALLPQYLGVGTFLVAWGGLAMLAPGLGKKIFGLPRLAAANLRRGLAWVAGTLAISGMLALIPLPYTMVVPLRLDIEGAYTLRTTVAGYVDLRHAGGEVEQGALLLHLREPDAAAKMELSRQEQLLYQILATSTGNKNPLAKEGAERRMAAAHAIAERLARDEAERTISAPAKGLFRPVRQTEPGRRMERGAPVGVFIPADRFAQLTGNFPEIYVEKFSEGGWEAELRHASGYLSSREALSIRLVQLEDARSTGERSFRADVRAQYEPGLLSGQDLFLRLVFKAEPIWKHAAFLYERLLFEFRSAQALAHRTAIE